jgi:hypothetical protein
MITFPVSTCLSQGVELEFLVAYLHTSNTDPDEAHASTLSPILRIDAKGAHAAEAAVLEHIRTTLRNHGIRVRERMTNFVAVVRDQDPTVPSHLVGLDEWDVGSDMSVMDGTAEAELVKDKGSAYRWLGIEVRSPARCEKPGTHAETRFVVNLLTSKYRLRVNLSCGFHVHVGNGARYFEPDTLKRLGVFLFAADPIVSRLHAPWRRVGNHSTSIRYRSRVACWEGITAADADRIVRQVAKDVEKMSHGRRTLDAIPFVPWSDTTREEMDFGGKAGWREYADNRRKHVPFITLDECAPRDTEKKRDEEEGSAYKRRFREFMSTPSFAALCMDVYGHGDPDALTVKEQYSLLALAQCETLFGHRRFGELSASGLHQVALACGPYLKKTGQDEPKSDVEDDDVVSWGSSSSDSGGDFRPAAWTTLYPTHSHDGNKSPGASKTQSPTKKLRPHDLAELGQSYRDKVGAAQRLTEGRWQRIPFWGPCPYPGEARDPGESHIRGGPDFCHGRRCASHVVNGTGPALAALFGVRSAAAVAALLCDAAADNYDTLPQRLNYNFRAYAPETLGDGSSVAKRTLEFREAAGSLDSEFILTWTRICVGIVRFCRDARPRDFADVLCRIADEEYRQSRRARRAHRKGRTGHDVDDDEEMYDVCDLLEDIGLFTEAAIVRRREAQLGPPR